MPLINDISTLPDDLPVPGDDGACNHLQGARLPNQALPSTLGESVNLSVLSGWSIVFTYPRTGVPGQPALSDDWNRIPGARGCTPQICGYRDLANDFVALGVRIFGLSTQTTTYQQEMVERIGVHFPVLSDHDLLLTKILSLPTITVAGHVLLRRMAWIVHNGVIETVFYPVFPPDACAERTLAWARAHLDEAC
ncbi:MAG: peroxiredoxin [Cyanobacteria bacterium P01_G01_bin.38]